MRELVLCAVLGATLPNLYGCSSDGVNASNCYGRAGNGCVEKYGKPVLVVVHSREWQRREAAKQNRESGN